MPRIISANPDELFWKRSYVAIKNRTALWRGCIKEELLIKNEECNTIDALLLMHVGSIYCTNKTISGHLTENNHLITIIFIFRLGPLV